MSMWYPTFENVIVDNGQRSFLGPTLYSACPDLKNICILLTLYFISCLILNINGDYFLYSKNGHFYA